MSVAAVEFLSGGLASIIAEIATLPADTVKVRMQIAGDKKNTFSITKDIINKEGLSALYQGLDVAVLRQALYGSFRYGLYPLLEKIIRENSKGVSPMFIKIAAGCGAGAISSALCNPTDLVKIRMQGNTMKEQTIMNAFRDISTNEGIYALWTTGLGPTVLRAAVLAAVEMSSYDLSRIYFVELFSLGNHSYLIPICSALVASMFSSLASCPFDLARSRVMNQQKNEKGVGLQYNGSIDCLVKSVKTEGVLVLWSGWIAFFLRLGPNTILTFYFLETIRLFFLSVWKITSK